MTNHLHITREDGQITAIDEVRPLGIIEEGPLIDGDSCCWHGPMYVALILPLYRKDPDRCSLPPA